MSGLALALRAAPWALMALCLVFGLWERAGWQSEIAARARDLAAAAAKVAALQAEDARRTGAIEARHAEEVATLKEQANAREVAIAAAPSGTGCVQSPAMRALFDGLRARPGAAGGGDPRGAGGTGAPLSR